MLQACLPLPWPCLQSPLLDGPLRPTLWCCVWPHPLLLLTRHPVQTPTSSPSSPGAVDGAHHQHLPLPIPDGQVLPRLGTPGSAQPPRASWSHTLPRLITGAWGAVPGQGRAHRHQGTHQGWFSSQSASRQRRLRGNSVKRPLNSSGGMWEMMLQRDILGTVSCGEIGEGT